MGRRRTYDGDVYSGGAFYILLYANVNQNQPVLFSSDAGRTFYTLNTPFKFVKGVVSKNGHIFCVGLSGDSFGVYISRDQGKSFNEINIPSLTDNSRRISLAITSDGSEAYILNKSTLYRYKEVVQEVISYDTELSIYRGDLMISGDGRILYMVLHKTDRKEDVRTFLSIDGGSKFLKPSYRCILNASRDGMLLGSVEPRFDNLYLLDVSLLLGQEGNYWGLKKVSHLYTRLCIGNNKVAYYTPGYDLYAADFKTRETRMIMKLAGLKDINAEGTVGVIRKLKYNGLLELVDLSKGEVIRSFEGATQHHIYAVIGK